MIAYEFYLRGKGNGKELVGILPERRKDPARITQKSILHWAETVLGNSLSLKDIYYIKVTINENRRDIFKPIPFLVVQKKVNK
jgi:hypothetical protein